MLHLKFALNLERLADEMIDKISDNWTDPFNAPIVIFPDFKLEQWFRLKWIKKKGSLLNLNNCSIDKFLFDILSADKTKRQKLNADMLCNVILAYLQQADETTNKPHWQTLDDEVKRYLYGDGEPASNVQPDANRLFDFASKMASLFLEYEASRPKEFAGNKTGLLDQWAEGASEDSLFFAASIRDKKNKAPVEARETWQRKLYSAIFHKKNGEISLLTKVFDKEAARKGTKKDYLTIPYLYKAWNENSNGEFNLKNIGIGKEGKPLPVFIFGLSGMGQFYRVILQKYAEKHDVYAYIQNPCMEFWEDAKQDSSYSRKWKKGNIPEDIQNIPENIQNRLNIQDYSGDTFDIDDIKEENVSEENALLANWGRSGRDNIKLWCQATDYDFDFDANSSPKECAELQQDSLLHCVQYSIAHRKKDFAGANLDDVFSKDSINEENKDAPKTTDKDSKKETKKVIKSKSLTIKSAPTKIREIEYLHSDICKLLQGDTRVEDILVVSPCLDDYRTAIKMVFDQTPVKLSKEEKKKNEGFLHVRFAIVDSPAKASLTENALNSLFDVLDKGSISRPEFFSLVRNPVVQQVRGISDDDVADWENWIVEMNTYRNRKLVGKNDWLHAVNRLLLSQMTRKNVEWSDCEDGLDETKPFYDIASSDKASLCRFVACVKDLEEWIENYNKPVSNLDALTAALGKWIQMQKVPDSMKSESFVYQRVVGAIDQLRYQTDTGLSEIPLKIVAQSLLAGAEGTEYSCGNLFVNGITFMKFVPNRTIPVKHLFFIGADSTSFPGAKRHNTLDLRKSCPPWPGDDSPIAKNRYAFLCQLMSASESFHMSYVGMDIKKDAELYPSSVISDLQKFVSEALKDTEYSWKTEKIPLDETRDASEIYTKKGLRNKVAYVNMVTAKKPSDGLEDSGNEDDSPAGDENKPSFIKPPDRVSFYQLRKFLEDPFQFHVGRTLSSEDEDNVEQELFEPVYLNHLDESIILKKAIAAELSDDAGEYENYKRELKLSGKMPDKLFGDEFWKKIDASKNLLLEQMINEGIVLNGAEDNPEESDGEKVIANCSFANDWTFGEKIKDMQLDRESSDDMHWLLSGTLDWINVKKEDGKELDWNKVSQLLSISSSTSATKGFKLDKFLSSYIQALAILAKQNDENERTIEILIFSCDKDKGGPAKAFVTQKPSDAKTKLAQIYMSAFGVITSNKKEQPFSKAVPAKMLDFAKQKNGNYDSEKLNIFEFKEELTKKHGGAWNYFDKKPLFDVLKDVGYSATSFNQEWPNAVNKMKGLIDIKFPEEPPKEPAEEEPVASTTDEPKKKAAKSKKAK